MARVTVEDCVIKISNRFELVMLAAQRAREIASGAAITLDRDDDKNPVVALREIAEDRVIPSILQESLVKGLQKHVEHDEPEEDSDVIIGEESWPLGAGGQAIASELEEDMGVEGEGEAEVDELDEDAVIPDFTELGEEPERE